LFLTLTDAEAVVLLHEWDTGGCVLFLTLTNAKAVVPRFCFTSRIQAGGRVVLFVTLTDARLKL
jgi:hypothetical protein